MPALNTSHQILSQELCGFVSNAMQVPVDPDTIKVTITPGGVRIEYQPASDVVPDHVATATDMRDMLKLVHDLISPDSAAITTSVLLLARIITRWGISASLHRGIVARTEKQLLEQRLAEVLYAYEQVDPARMRISAANTSTRA